MRLCHLCYTWIVIVGLSATTPTQAFDKIEHENVSDNAFKLALVYHIHKHTKNTSVDFCDDQQTELLGVASLLLECGVKSGPNGVPEQGITYGEITRAVDDLLYPRQIFVNDDPRRHQKPLRFAPSSFEDLHPKFRRRRGSPHVIKKQFNDLVDGARALANNETHFQNALMRQYIELQQDSFEAAREQELYFALVNKALSDHFLQDFFAPGHILWPRENSHDNIALATHDATNRDGAYIEVNADAWKRIKPLAEFVVEHKGSLGSLWLNPRSRRARLTDCDDSVRALFQAVECLMDTTPTDPAPSKIKVFGDGKLTKSPRQQAYLVLAQAYAITQIFEHYYEVTHPGSKKNATSDHIDFKRVNWQGSFHESDDNPNQELRSPTAGLWFGDYDFEVKDTNGISLDRFKNRASSVLLLNLGGQVPLRDIDSSRLIASIEYAPIGQFSRWPGVRNAIVQRPSYECKFLSLCNTGLLFGAHLVKDEKLDGFGPGLRFVKVIPAVDLQTSVYVNAMRYKHAKTEYETTYGVRVDWGFSAGSFFLQFGKEQFLDKRNKLEGTGMFTAGVGFGLPVARFRKWFENRSYDVEESQ